MSRMDTKKIICHHINFAICTPHIYEHLSKTKLYMSSNHVDDPKELRGPLQAKLKIKITS